MAHARKLFRHAAIARLVAAATVAQSRVYTQRIDPLKKGSLPAISLYIPNEDIDDGSAASNPRELKRMASMEVAIVLGGVNEDTLADAADDAAGQVEAVFDDDPFISETVEDCVLTKTDLEIREVNGASDPLIAFVVLTYLVTYRTRPAEAAQRDDFLRTKATLQPTGGVVDTQPEVNQFDVRGTTP